MDIQIQISANSEKLLQEKENNDLNQLALDWNEELEKKITNPAHVSNGSIVIHITNPE